MYRKNTFNQPFIYLFFHFFPPGVKSCDLSEPYMCLPLNVGHSISAFPSASAKSPIIVPFSNPKNNNPTINVISEYIRYPTIIPYIYIIYWLVVSTLWKKLVSWDDYSQYMETKKCLKPPTNIYIFFFPHLLRHRTTQAIISGTSISVRVGGTISPAAWTKRCSTKLDVPWIGSGEGPASLGILHKKKTSHGRK